jgi:hypothetical protein
MHVLLPRHPAAVTACCWWHKFESHAAVENEAANLFKETFKYRSMAMHVAGVAAKILRISYNCRPSNVDPGDDYRAARITIN